MYLGDFAEDGDLYFKFTTRAFATGVPTTLAGSPVLSVYKDEGGAATEKTTAETYFDLDVDHDSIAGWHNVRIDLSGDAFFATGADYSVVITTGTVGGVNVFGENLANFSIENRSMGQPAGATLAADVAAIKTETALIVGDTNELQTDWADGGRLDLIQDIIAADTTTDIPALIATAQADLDTITGTSGVLIGTDAANVTEISDAVWDEATSAHNVAGSFGKAARQMNEGVIAEESTVSDAGPTTTEFDTALTEASDAHYNDSQIVFIDGDLKGQSRTILTYTGASKNILVDEAWTEAPANGDGFIILTGHVHPVAQIADGVWDEDATGHQTGGTFGQAIGDPGANAETMYDAVVTDAAGTNVAVDVVAVKADTAATLVDTAEIGVAGAGLTNINLPNQTMDIVGDITGDLSGSVGSVTARVTANTDQIAGVAAAATQLSLSADTVVGLGTASGTPTTTTMISDIGVTVDDQLNGRTIIFADDTTTAALRDQATDITACTAATNTLTFTALTTAPVSGDTFIVV